MKRHPRSRPTALASQHRPVPERMAEAMLEAACLRGECHMEDLLQAGFSLAQIKDHANTARAIAGRRQDAGVPA